MVTKFEFSKLKNEANYSVWSIRAEAYLIKEGFISSLSDIVRVHQEERESTSSSLTNIGNLEAINPTSQRRTLDNKGLACLKLIVEDGPLNHIRHSECLGDAWVTLKGLYDREGFSSLFILIKRLISLNCKRDKVNDFLNSIREIVNTLESKGVALPDAFVNAWILERLDKSYNGFKSSIYNSFRIDEKAYSLESLSSLILDEYRRKKSSEESTTSSSEEEEKALLTKKPWKKSKGKYCSHCKKLNHNPAECFILHPELKRKKKVEKSTSISNSNSNRLKREKALLAALSKAYAEVEKDSEKEKEKALVAAVRQLGLQKSLPMTPSTSQPSLLDQQGEESDNLMEIELVDTAEVLLLTQKEEKEFTNSLKGIMSKLKDNKPDKSTQNGAMSWILDNGATSHIVCNRDSFSSYTAINKTIHWGEASTLNIQGIGTIYVQFQDTQKIRVLNNVLYVPELGINILSQSKLANNYTISFPSYCLIIDLINHTILTKGIVKSGLYYLSIVVLTQKSHLQRSFMTSFTLHTNSMQNAAQDKYLEKDELQPDFTSRKRTTTPITTKETLIKSNNIELKDSIIEPNGINALAGSTNLKSQNLIEVIHKRFGHINLKAIQKIAKDYNIKLIANSYSSIQCPECYKAKMHQQKHKKSLHSNSQHIEYLEKVSSDICGPISPLTWDKKKYFITFLDKKTRWLVVTLLSHKSEALQAFKDFKAKAENNSKRKRIINLHTDNGREYISKEFTKILSASGINHELTAPYTKEPNGIIERINLTLLNKVRAMLYTANLPQFLWGEAILAAAFLYNITPHTALESYISPFQAKKGYKPHINNVYIFGSICYYRDNTPKLKLAPRSNKAIIIGYGQEANIYKVWDFNKKRALWTRDVKVLEKETLTNSASLNKTSLLEVANSEKQVHTQDLESPQAKDPLVVNSTRNNSLSNSTQKESTIEIVLPKKSARFLAQYKTVDEEQLNYSQELEEKEAIFIATNIHNEPSNYKEAITSPNRAEWQAAMQEEVNSLTNSNTYKLVDLPQGRVALGGRWVYKLKYDNNGNIARYKARWVIQGYNQVLGIDYLDTFSITCRPVSYRLFLIIAIKNNWHIKQYDVHCAFLHASIDKEIYTIQPTGFIKDPTKRCLLNKASYGLKQSPRLWYNHLKDLLIKEGFIVFPYDEGVFIHIEKQLIINCHVDDFLIMGAKLEAINTIAKNLEKSLKLTSLGDISEFLGNEIIIDRKKKSIFIHQTKYTKKILKLYNKTSLQPASTPYEAGVKLRKATQQASKEEIQDYQQQIGSLLYLALKTRPDIAFAVNKCSRFMSNPDASHFKALDRIWSYLLKYPNLGLYYDCTEDTFAKVYSDSDWASNIDDRKSTQAYLSCIGNNPLNWNTKLQKTVACSSLEAEYMALKAATQESLYLLYALSWLQSNKLVNLTNSYVTILTDNMGAKQLAENPAHHERTKHIDIAYHFIRNQVALETIKVVHIPDKLQLADPLTKGVHKAKIDWFKETIRLKSLQDL